MKTILIIEDEDAAFNRLSKMITVELPDSNILPQIVSIKSAVEWLETNVTPDLIFLDVHLADGESFEIFKKTRVNSPIIFTTAYDQYALEAFKVNSIDYLLKPIKKEELNRAIDKFHNLKNSGAADVNIQKLLSTLQTNNQLTSRDLLSGMVNTLRLLKRVILLISIRRARQILWLRKTTSGLQLTTTLINLKNYWIPKSSSVSIDSSLLVFIQ
jgi:DNA-binding LytR/AlgR family response regulator